MLISLSKHVSQCLLFLFCLQNQNHESSLMRYFALKTFKYMEHVKLTVFSHFS